MSAPKIVYVCKHCGSSDVQTDALAEWDAKAQTWVLGDVYDNDYCRTCEGETRLIAKPYKPEKPGKETK